MTTIKDIAKAAGVSVTTVSRALNGYSDVKELTRQKIAAVAKEMNYSPNTLARSLVMNKSQTIGLLVSGFTKESVKDNFTVEVLAGVNECTSEMNYDLVLFNTNSSMQREKTYTQLCRERRVDGVIIQGIRTDDPYLKEVVDSDIPCVLIDIPISSDRVGYVTTDNELGADKAVQHLLELGHRNIGMVNGHEYAFVSQKRLNGYKRALENAGISFKPEFVVDGSFKEDEANFVTKDLLMKHPEITALFCASDLMAIGAMKAAQELGKKVPEDISIIGYDDILLASYVSPALTTIAQNKFQLGFEAARMLLDLLTKGDQPKQVILNTELKKRESTGLQQ
ncbi:LacI family transcriptional regulator [Rossellomorea vietnamensis]|uniref:LacI family transcriptional regulator n=2 Tax=Rossellomorea TaxID=2837508 RepID=A0A5D4KEV4_9BACI|nr:MULTISPECIES: LacI family DNA-binding transcriptional regulator [Rossellomorea]TYR75360.1 LacI family transcriptional regulator [Rossellomorea vietnamensis]TYS78342.1 LacI family transcriptional regulator [Rossellomorea aquimaris]